MNENKDMEEVSQLEEDEAVLKEKLQNMKVGEVQKIKIDGEFVMVKRTKDKKAA